MIGVPYRPDERSPAPLPLRTRGVRILYAGKRYFVPGGTVETALGLARLAGLIQTGADIEFGEVRERVGTVGGEPVNRREFLAVPAAALAAVPGESAAADPRPSDLPCNLLLIYDPDANAILMATGTRGMGTIRACAAGQLPHPADRFLSPELIGPVKRWSIAVHSYPDGITTTAPCSGSWVESQTDTIQTDINLALIRMECLDPNQRIDDEGIVLQIPHSVAVQLANTPEIRSYMAGAPDALAALQWHNNPNQKYGLTPYLYGCRLVVGAPRYIPGPIVVVPASATPTVLGG